MRYFPVFEIPACVIFPGKDFLMDNRISLKQLSYFCLTPAMYLPGIYFPVFNYPDFYGPPEISHARAYFSYSFLPSKTFFRFRNKKQNDNHTTREMI